MNFVQELRRSFRTLARDPGIALIAVITLGLGIGLPTAMFGIVDAALFRGLPGIPDSRAIVHLEGMPEWGRGEGFGASPADYEAWREQQRSFEDLGAYRTATVALRADAGTDRWTVALLTPTAMAVLGTAAERGRTLREEDARAGADAVAVLSVRLWRDRFGSDPAILGRTVWMNGEPRTIVGLMPESFRFPVDADVWLPLTLTQADLVDPGDRSLGVIGRLRDGVTVDEARRDMAVVAARVAARHPATHDGWGIAVKPIMTRYLGETPAFQLRLVLGAVLLVLVVACTNVANLLLVRMAGRMREIGIRSALGGTRTRIAWQIFLESAVLAVGGAVVGVGVAVAGLAAMRRTFGDQLPPWMTLEINITVLAFALGLAAAGAVLAGLLPAVRTTRGDLVDVLRDATRGATGLRIGRITRSLVVVQVGLSFALMVVTGLLGVAVYNVRTIDFAFATEDVLTARITLPDAYAGDDRSRFYDELRAALVADPRTMGAAVATALPADRAPRARVALQGRTYDDDRAMPLTPRAAVSPGFFETFGVTPIQGRVIETGDRAESSPVIVVNRAFANRHFAGESAIGRQVRFGDATNTTDEPWRTIVGIVPDMWMSAFDASGDRNPAGIYVPLAQIPLASASVAVRVRAGSPLTIASLVREAALTLDRDVPIYNVRTMPELIEDNSWFYGWAAGIMASAGATALLLAAVGLYGVMAFWVRGRRRELGIRAAIGARPGQLVGLVFRRGATYVGIGLALGLGLALFLGRGLNVLLFEVDAADPLIIGGIATFLAVTGAVAMLVPGLRAARTQPMEVLRTD